MADSPFSGTGCVELLCGVAVFGDELRSRFLAMGPLGGQNLEVGMTKFMSRNDEV
jgi:hypothetical protein